MPPTDEPLLTLEEVVAYLRVNPRTVYRLLQTGQIPAVRVGRQWRFRRSALDAWLRKQDTGQGDAAPSPEAVPPVAPEQERRRVVVVDDDPGIRELFRQMLMLPRYQVLTVPDGQTAIEYLQVERIDLLIVDLQLPGVGGMEVIRTARRLAPLVPVIIITGHSSEASAIDAVNLGVKAYLIKPFSIRQVLTTIEEVLGE